MKKGLLITLCCFAIESLLVNTIGQTGPGGIGSASSNPLWYDASSLILVDGSAVSSWTDMSGNSSHALQANSLKRPVYDQVAVNGKPSVAFNGTNQHLIAGANTNLNNPNKLSYYIVAEVDNFSGNRIPFNLDYGTVAKDFAWTGFIAQTGNLYNYGRSNLYLEKALINPSSGFNIYGGNYNNATNTLFSSLNFTTNQTITSASYHPSNPHENTWIGGSPTTYYFDGSIAEVFAFNFTLNAAQEKILQNYISAKYGIAISSDMYSYESTHSFGVIGLGQEAAGVSQTNSKGWDIVQLHTPSNLANGEYLFAGHSGDALSVISSNVPDLLPTAARFERTWRVEKTGDLGTVTVVFHLDASTNFSADPNNYRLVVDTDGDFDGVVDQIVSGSYNALAQTVTFTNIYFETGDFFTLAGDAPEDIHSIASGMWNDPNTWDCSCIPSLFNSVFIEPTHDVEVDANAVCLNLTVEATATLTMNVASTVLDVNGFCSFLGTLNASQGEISFSGTSEQYIDSDGGTINFNDIRISTVHALGFTFYDGMYVLNGAMFPDYGLINVDNGSGASLIVNSTSATDNARIAAINPSSTITGSVTVRRFIPAGTADYRDIAPPVIGATLSMWDQDLFISGTGFPDGCAYDTSGCFFSASYYLGDTKVDLTNINTVLINGKGYEVFMGDDLNTFNATTLEVTGTLNGSGDLSKSVNNSWSTYGNPFASPITFSGIVKTGGASNYYYVYNTTTGSYEYYDGGDGSSSIPELAGGIIPIGQGFWIYGSGAGMFKYPQSCLTGSASTFVKSDEVNTNILNITLMENASTYRSSIALVQNNIGQDDIDTNDVLHFWKNDVKAPSIAFYLSTELVRKNHIENDGRNKSFDIYTNILNAGEYTIGHWDLENFTNYRSVLLFDKATNQFIDLKQEDAYTFYSEVFEGHRFMLILTNEGTSEESTVQSLTLNELATNENQLMTITQMGNSFNVELAESHNEDSQVKLINVIGQTEVYSSAIRFVQGSNIITVPAELKGVHILIITTGDKIVTKKVVL